MASLHEVLRVDLKLSDEVFAQKAKVDRSLVCRYRTGKAVPRGDTAERILKALKKLGVEMTLTDLLSKPKRPRKAA